MEAPERHLVYLQTSGIREVSLDKNDKKNASRKIGMVSILETTKITSIGVQLFLNQL